jgi:chromosome segregation ATPase
MRESVAQIGAELHAATEARGECALALTKARADASECARALDQANATAAKAAKAAEEATTSMESARAESRVYAETAARERAAAQTAIAATALARQATERVESAHASILLESQKSKEREAKLETKVQQGLDLAAQTAAQTEAAMGALRAKAAEANQKVEIAKLKIGEVQSELDTHKSELDSYTVALRDASEYEKTILAENERLKEKGVKSKKYADGMVEKSEQLQSGLRAMEEEKKEADAQSIIDKAALAACSARLTQLAPLEAKAAAKKARFSDAPDKPDWQEFGVRTRARRVSTVFV